MSQSVVPDGLHIKQSFCVNVFILRFSLHARLYNIVDKVALKRTGESHIEANIETKI